MGADLPRPSAGVRRFSTCPSELARERQIAGVCGRPAHARRLLRSELGGLRVGSARLAPIIDVAALLAQAVVPSGIFQRGGGCSSIAYRANSRWVIPGPGSQWKLLGYVRQSRVGHPWRWQADGTPSTIVSSMQPSWAAHPFQMPAIRRFSPSAYRKDPRLDTCHVIRSAAGSKFWRRKRHALAPGLTSSAATARRSGYS